MAYAYSPGLKRALNSIVKKTRKLPIRGKVLVKPGDVVLPDTVVVEATIQGEAQIVRVSSMLGIDPDQLKHYMLKKEGERVKKDESIASYKALFGLIRRVCQSPADGTIELVSNVTGQVVVRETSSSIALKAFIPGVVLEILPEQGAVIECQAAYLQGIFGIGGEIYGDLRIAAASPEDILGKETIGPGCEGKILVGGSLVTADALRQAIRVGVKGIIAGGIEDKDLADFLGYEIGVAITGSEEVGLTLIILEGFSKMPPSERTFEILKRLDGKPACVNGATQIRAGVIRPEIIVPLEGSSSGTSAKSTEDRESIELRPGATVRMIREPYFGLIGRIVSLPVELQVMESESRVRVLEVALENGQEITVPRANIETLQE